LNKKLWNCSFTLQNRWSFRITRKSSWYKVVTADEIKEGKLKDYLALINKQLIFFAENIDGYKYKMEILSSLPEAMAVLGLQLPE